MSLLDPVVDPSNFRIQLPAELYLDIAEWLGKELQETTKPMYSATTDDDDDDEVVRDLTRIGTIISKVREMHPTMAMLNAGMVNKYYHQTITGITLRWDATSENPRAIYHAAVHNHANLLRQALEQPGAKPDFTPYGHRLPSWTPLMVAASKGYAQVVDLLLQKGANAALSFACKASAKWKPRPFVQNLESMPEHSLNEDLLDKPTPLHAAMLAPQNALVMSKNIIASLPPRFLSKIADPAGLFLAVAVAQNHLELVDMLINRGADFDHGGLTIHEMSLPVLHHAISGEMVLKLTLSGAPLQTPPQVGLNALHAVCLRQTDCSTAIRELVRQGVNVNEATAGADQRPALLVSHPALLGRIPQTALSLACRQLNVAHIQTLLELGAHPLGACPGIKSSENMNNGEFFMVTPLHDVFLPDDSASNLQARSPGGLGLAMKAAVHLLLSHPMGSHALSCYGNVRLGQPDVDVMAKISQRYWVDASILEVPDFGDYTPLQLFFIHPFVDDPDIPQAMFDLSEDGTEQINSVIEPYYTTPLLALLGHRFNHALGDANFYRPRLVEWILQHGADPNIADREGLTPLHYAVFWLDARAVELLIQYGARVDPKDELKVIEVLFGRVYSKEHQNNRVVHRSAWKQMVKLVDEHAPTMHGVRSCIKRWQPDTPLPACTFPHFEAKFSHAAADLMRDDAVHPQIVARWGGLYDGLRGDADDRRRRIFVALVQVPRVLPFAKPKVTYSERYSHGFAPRIGTIRYSVMDWAMATDQNAWFLHEIERLGGRMGVQLPTVGGS
ncbi:hypothetical protein CORC01_10657 [Colletotrichum orchidophilum]|uniref:Ankyrin repeat protein n=1 Tax=Colletotrichum orchidophilum TaxID=1209926 RepID=A0A1G4AYG5_9PEZI|nr:uncharacterized protein CORC01_10657 [Colletotrichum orchidophilum]OHE94082.1 hypothetical protein CORC01_10657 [Colletotrichum orchidophilum]